MAHIEMEDGPECGDDSWATQHTHTHIEKTLRVREYSEAKRLREREIERAVESNISFSEKRKRNNRKKEEDTRQASSHRQIYRRHR